MTLSFSLYYISLQLYDICISAWFDHPFPRSRYRFICFSLSISFPPFISLSLLFLLTLFVSSVLFSWSVCLHTRLVLIVNCRRVEECERDERWREHDCQQRGQWIRALHSGIYRNAANNHSASASSFISCFFCLCRRIPSPALIRYFCSAVHLAMIFYFHSFD